MPLDLTQIYSIGANEEAHEGCEDAVRRLDAGQCSSTINSKNASERKINGNAEVSTLQIERNICSEAWYILKSHAGITQCQEQEFWREWEQIADRCKKLYETQGNAAQKKLAQGISMAIIDYYKSIEPS